MKRAFLDENDFKKKLRGLRMYFPRAYKYLIFKVFNGKFKYDESSGLHYVELPVGKIEKLLYGPFRLYYYCQNETVIITDLTPKILQLGHMKILDVYKGYPITSEQDIFKIECIMREVI